MNILISQLIFNPKTFHAFSLFILFLLGHTDSFSLVTGGLGVLTSHTETPVVTQTTMGANLLQTLQVLTELVVQDVGHHLGGLAVLDVSLSVQEPVGDLVLTGVLTKEIKIINILTRVTL